MAPEDKPVSSPFLTQDDRIAIAEALAAGVPVVQIAERLGKHRSTSVSPYAFSPTALSAAP